MNANELADSGVEIVNDKQIAAMNVYELAEYLNGWYSTAAPRKAAAMLRQQQTEIEALKDFAIWMTGCSYDFTQHDYFIKCRDKLLKKASEK
jgi:hypothetical protein